MAVTFLEVFPLTQVMEVFLAAIGTAEALADGEGVGDGAATAAS